MNCAQCRGIISAEDALYDEHAENYFCDRDCFNEWTDGNFSEVSEYYFRHNVGY